MYLLILEIYETKSIDYYGTLSYYYIFLSITVGFSVIQQEILTYKNTISTISYD